MLSFVPFALFVSTVNAVNFFGDTASSDVFMNTIIRLVEPLEEAFSNHSVFTSSDLEQNNGSDFLAAHGILETTLMDLISQGESSVPSSTPSHALDTREPEDQLNCDKNAVVDKIIPKHQKSICNLAASLVAGGVGAVGVLVGSTACSEGATGHPVGCRTIVSFVGTAGVTMTSGEVKDWCLDYISANDKKCDSKGVKGDTGDKRAHVAVVNTQSDDVSCSGITGKCKEYHA